LGIAAPIALGGIMELAQMLLTVNRSGEWADFIADTLGVLAGAAAGLFILRPLIWRKR
jgi:VanZ family protein